MVQVPVVDAERPERVLVVAQESEEDMRALRRDLDASGWWTDHGIWKCRDREEENPAFMRKTWEEIHIQCLMTYQLRG
jgi:hypothetical protein